MRLSILKSKTPFQLALIASLGLTAACSQTRQLSEMHDSTGEMRDTTKDMAAQTKAMSDTTKNMEQLTAALGVKTEELRAMTGQLLQVGKQGIAMGLRETVMKDLEAATSQVEKLGKAAKYFMAFEFQIWNGLGPDTDATRDDQMASAAREFMREVQRYIGEDAKKYGVLSIASPEAAAKVQALIDKESIAKAQTVAADRAKAMQDALKGTNGVLSDEAKIAIQKASVVSGDDIEQAKEDHGYAPLLPLLQQGANINAFAVAMHIANPLQDELVRANPNIKEITMYSMIQDALLADKEIEAGNKKPADYPAYVNEVRSFVDVATVLVRARVNALGFMAMTRVSELLSAADPVDQLMQMAKDKGTDDKGNNLNWVFETRNLNSKAVRDTSLFLEGAIKTRDFMKKAGIAEDDSCAQTRTIFSIGQPNDEMKKARDTVNAAKAAGADVPERAAALAELMDRIDQIKQK